MSKRPIITAIFVALTIISSMGVVDGQHMQVSLFGANIQAVSGILLKHAVRIEPKVYLSDATAALSESDDSYIGKIGQWSYCDYTLPEAPTYSVEMISAEVDENIQAGQVFMGTMTFKNTGNTRLFSSKSECENVPVFNVGTQMATDRASIFGLSSVAMSGWTSSNRIKMSNEYVDPEQDFTVIFQSIAPEGDNIYKEYFQPVVENISWIGAPFAVDITVGSPSEEMVKNMSFVKDPITIAASDLVGKQKSLNIDLSDQSMSVKMGDITIWRFLISSGAYATPTPTGTFPIISKQELRIGGAWPHYRMPYFMMWRKDGYGIHALPYLATDGGTFWNEARDHIGKPVSHGCIRSLPEDATIMYAFADIGTPVIIQP